MPPLISDLRVHAAGQPAPRPNGDLVLYWLQTTRRAEYNFALRFAADRADELGLPLLVYQSLTPDYPWASDRHHTFELESAAELSERFAQLGIQYAFALSHEPRDRITPGDTPLIQLARRAAVVVTDCYPSPRPRHAVAALRRRVEAPVIAVDSCTVVPLAYHERAHLTARTFRREAMEAYRHFLAEPATAPELRRHRPIDLPFEPTRLAAGEIAELVAQSAVDHDVPPVAEFVGGTLPARARLQRFLATGLPRYAESRRDPSEDATSRLSPWLHYGCIAPHEVISAAIDAGPARQVESFLHEALVWRELSHNLAWHVAEHTTAEAIPAWARKELRDQEAEERPALYDLSTLEQAATDSPAWNAAQRQYLERGWMHNDLRMRWGKQLIQWTRTHEEAFDYAVRLNDRWALDGQDPNSYAGILWLFGKFDRPFYRRRIYGTVRYMGMVAGR